MYITYYLLFIVFFMIVYILYNRSNISNNEEFLNYTQCTKLPVSNTTILFPE